MLGDLLTTLSFAIPVSLMQAQQYSVPPHPGYYNIAQNTYPTVPEHYTASSVGDFTSFSRGSSLVYPQDYQYFSHCGPSNRHSSSNFIDTQSIDATVSGLAGNCTASTDMNYRPEDMVAYQPWRWTDPPMPEASVPMVSSLYSGSERGKNSLDYAFVTTPTTATSLPTPAAMADMMNRTLQLDVQVGHQQVSFQMPAGQSVTHASATVPRTSRTESGGQRLHSVPDTQSREKKHACSMCHKRFDRPSTLRKHLLVHTGEKAFVCDTCGRRFGVASNLNRHVRRCILKPIHTVSVSPNDSTSGSTQSVSPVPSNSSHTPMGPLSGQGNKRTKTRALSSDQYNISTGQESQPSERHADIKPVIPKRKRRAPSPSQWIPGSLSHFNLGSEEMDKATPVPLPPVRRSLPREERDSWDENINATPYHPRGWKNVLPGPGLGTCSGFGGKDVRNLNIGGDSSYMLGRVLVF